jgi:hypothetical protein
MSKKTDDKPASADDKLQKFLDKAKKQLKRCVESDEHNRKEAVDCLKMLNGDNMWDDEEIKRRKLEGRPCLKVPLFPVFVNQVVGEMLHNRARAKVKPGDHKSSQHIAKIRSGIISNTEYRSNGEDIYMTAGKSQVACGYGAWRVNTRYTEENPFVQEMYLEAIPNPFNVYLDPLRKDEAGADAKFGFILTKYTRDQFEEEWPDADWPSEIIKTGLGMKDELYFDRDFITLAEYFVVKSEKVMMCQMEDGTVITREEADELIATHTDGITAASEQAKSSEEPPVAPSPTALPAPLPAPPLQGQAGPPPAAGPQPPLGQPPMPQASPAGAPPQPGVPPMGMLPMQPGAPAPPPPTIVKERPTYIRKVKYYTLTATAILGPKKSANMTDKEHATKLLDGEDFPGEYVPIVQVLGITQNIEGKTYVKGLIRDARDAQKMVNYCKTAVAEAIAMSPKAPYMLTPRQVEGFEEDYKNANVKNNPFLLYNMDVESGVPAPPPIRTRPGDPPVALFNQAAMAVDDLKRVIGIFGGDIGEGGPERTGAAVYAKQKPSDVGSYVYAYKLNRGIEHSAKIMNSMIPTLYDTERDVRIRNIDDTETVVPINTTVRAAIEKMQRYPATYRGMNPAKLVEMYQRGDDMAKLNDIAEGKYEVVVTVGPSYATARQEASQQMMSLINSVPSIGKLGGDLIIEGIMDNQQGEKLAARIRKTMPPGLVALHEGEKPYQPPPPPQVMLMQQKSKTEELKQENQKLTSKIKMIELVKEITESKNEQTKEMRKVALEILSELHAPMGAHPADAQLMGGQE